MPDEDANDCVIYISEQQQRAETRRRMELFLRCVQDARRAKEQHEEEELRRANKVALRRKSQPPDFASLVSLAVVVLVLALFISLTFLCMYHVVSVSIPSFLRQPISRTLDPPQRKNENLLNAENGESEPRFKPKSEETSRSQQTSSSKSQIAIQFAWPSFRDKRGSLRPVARGHM